MKQTRSEHENRWIQHVHALEKSEKFVDLDSELDRAYLADSMDKGAQEVIEMVRRDGSIKCIQLG